MKTDSEHVTNILHDNFKLIKCIDRNLSYNWSKQISVHKHAKFSC